MSSDNKNETPEEAVSDSEGNDPVTEKGASDASINGGVNSEIWSI